MADNLCNCLNECDKFSQCDGDMPDGDIAPIYYCGKKRIYWDDEIAQTKRCGCLSHSLARQELNKEVIVELERIIEQNYDLSPSNKDDNGKMYNNDELGAWEDALSLIQNGVKKL